MKLKHRIVASGQRHSQAKPAELTNYELLELLIGSSLPTGLAAKTAYSVHKALVLHGLYTPTEHLLRLAAVRPEHVVNILAAIELCKRY